MQNKAKMLIDNLIASSGQNCVRGGTEKGKKCEVGEKILLIVFHIFGSLLESFCILVLVFCKVS